ncbi:MAG: hypothetical protein ACRDEA_23265 [Microcystaceae cyanobacterium]
MFISTQWLNRWYRRILAAIILVLLTACTSLTPPRELAPQGELIQKAIALQLKLTEQLISEQLNASHPDLNINQISVKKLEPLFIAKLPTYHLQGTYHLKIKLPRQQVNQKNEKFDIYLQRQVEGKTWRLLKRDTIDSNQKPQWSSYLIR